MSYRVVIPTAGVGSRLLEQTENINKSLINVSNKPVISHIIESFPNDVEFPLESEVIAQIGGAADEELAHGRLAGQGGLSQTIVAGW